ncbi:prepilin peptidase [Lachnospiraceae bacterium LCP25S3_G4]
MIYFRMLITIMFIFGIIVGKLLRIYICQRLLCMEVVKPITRFHYHMVHKMCYKGQEKESIQYRIFEGINGTLYGLIFLINGCNIVSMLYCFLSSALLVLSIIDVITHEIPIEINLFILMLGMIRIALDYTHWQVYVIGFLSTSVPLKVLFICSRGKAIGGGDIKLMASTGLLLGWKETVLAFFVGCLLGSIIHMVRIKVSKAQHIFAMGPYLSIGIFFSALWGEDCIRWYLNYF